MNHERKWNEMEHSVKQTGNGKFFWVHNVNECGIEGGREVERGK